MSAISPILVLESKSKSQWTPESAIRFAWMGWIAMGFVPFVVFLVLICQQAMEDVTPALDDAMRGWFIASMMLTAILVPGAFFIQARRFNGYWHGQPVKPVEYLRGMFTVWSSLVISGIFSLIGCFATGSIMPNLLPAMAAFMLYMVLWPNGHAMSRRLHREEDGGEYKEPR